MKADAPSGPPPPSDPSKAAKAAGLRYVSRDALTIRRERSGDKFIFKDAGGKRITDLETLDRIHRLGLPPAWTDVRIAPQENAHLQATGRDARGRLQYRYHAAWREVRDESKFHRMLEFGRSLPAIRDRIEKDLTKRGLPREKVLAAVVRLIETTLIRVGNDAYAKDNDSFGATTLRDGHADVSGTIVKLRFRAKSGKEAAIDFRDRRLARIMKKCQDLPGQELFQYVDEDGKVRDVVSDDVNSYLKEITGQDFTAKDFRTFFATLYAAQELACAEAATSRHMARRVVKKALESVASRLGNTVAICRKSYVHPALVEAYHNGALGALSALAEADPDKGAEAEELVVDFLAEKLNAPAPRRKPATKPLPLAEALRRSASG